MEMLAPASPASLPSLFTVRPEARKRLRDFFSSHIRNKNTRRAYLEAVRQFSAFCAQHGIVDLAQVEPVHVAAFVEDQLREQFQAYGETKAGSAADALRLDGRRPGALREPSSCGARAEAYAAERKDTGLGCGRGVP